MKSMLAIVLLAFYGVASAAASGMFNTTIIDGVEICYDFQNHRDIQAYGLAQAVLIEDLDPDVNKKHPHLYNTKNELIPFPAPSATDPPRSAARPVAAAGDDDIVDSKIFATRAVQFWVQKEYLKFYEKYGLNLTPDEISSATAAFNKFKLDQFESNGKAGVVMNLGTSELKAVIDLWVKAALMTDLDAQVLKVTLDGDQSQQDAKDYGHKRGNGDMIFGRVGFISLKVRKNDPPTGTMVYMFRKFHFNFAMDVKIEKTKQCFVWGLFCKSEVKVTSTEHSLTGEESTQLGNYMKWQAAKNYEEVNGPNIRYLTKEAGRYSNFLPDAFKKDWSKINSQPNTDPSELVSKNALDPQNYDI